MENQDNEFIYYVKEPKQLNDLTKKFLTGEYILFGRKPNNVWARVYWDTIGALEIYKLVKKKKFPSTKTCGDCAYFNNSFCNHKLAKDSNIKNNDTICNIGRFVAVPYNWGDYSVDEKNRFVSDVSEFRHGK